MNTVKMSKVVEKMNLKDLTPDVDHIEKQVKLPDINRPALYDAVPAIVEEYMNKVNAKIGSTPRPGG